MTDKPENVELADARYRLQLTHDIHTRAAELRDAIADIDAAFPDPATLDVHAILHAALEAADRPLARARYAARLAIFNLTGEMQRPTSATNPRDEEAMTDRTDHRAAAERLLTDADEWAEVAGEPTPAAGELSCLACAAVHALLAIHDALTAADRYAANEAKQREAEPEAVGSSPDNPFILPASVIAPEGTRFTPYPTPVDAYRAAAPVIDYEDIREGMTIEATYSNGTRLRFVATRGYSTDSWADPSGCFQITPPGTEGLDPGRVIRLIDPPAESEAEQREAAAPDPLDEDDHRDRQDRHGDIWVREPGGCWHIPFLPGDCCALDCEWTLAYLNERYGPLTFAPEAAQEAAGDDLSASEGESGAEERGEADNAQKAILCPECGDHINAHDVAGCRHSLCDCPRTPEDVTRALIDPAAIARTTVTDDQAKWFAQILAKGRLLPRDLQRLRLMSQTPAPATSWTLPRSSSK